MAFSYGFFDAKEVCGEPDRTYTSKNFSDYLGSLICNGIQDNYGDCFSLSTDGFSVIVGTGKAWINGHYFISDSPYTVDLSDYQDETLSRYVSVSIVCDTSEDVRNVHIEITPGTPAVNPETADFSDISEKTRLILCNVLLNPSAVSLSESDLYDCRDNENMCGYVKCILGKCRVTELMNEYETLTNEVQGLRQQVEDLAKVETEMQEYIIKTGNLQNKVDTLFGIVGFISGEKILDAGKIGDKVYYVLYGNGTAELIGSGETYDFSNQIISDDGIITPFLNNTNVKELIISDEITYLGNMLFAGTSLTSVEISANIGSGTFGNCTGLKTIRTDCEEIGSMAFLGCTNLESVTISTAVNKIGHYAFTHSATIINYEGTLEQWENIQKNYWADEVMDSSQTVQKVICTDGCFEYDSEDEIWYETQEM